MSMLQCYHILYCRYVSEGTAGTRLIGLAEIDYGQAERILNTNKSLLRNADLSNPRWVRKMSVFGADGVSVSLSATGAIGALFFLEVNIKTSRSGRAACTHTLLTLQKKFP